MGLIKTAVNAVRGALADQWLEFIEPDRMSDTTVMAPGIKMRAGDSRNSNFKGSASTVSNGSYINVYPNQLMMLIDNGKIVDYTVEPGRYKVDHSSLPSLFNGEFGEVLKETFDRYRFGGITPGVQKVYYINLQEIKGIKFGTKNPISYFDNFYNAELFLRGFGTYSIKIVNAIKFYMEAIPKDKERVDINDINEQYLSEFLTAFQTAINQMSVDGIRISHVLSKGDMLRKYMMTVLDEEWNEMRGMEIRSVGIDSISYDAESNKLIHMRNTGAMLEKPGIREGYVQGSIARGMEAAGSNANGSMAGFMGMGVGMQAAGGFMGAASQTNSAQMQQMQESQMREQQRAAEAKEEVPGAAALPKEEWQCSCGEMNGGRFCTSCGGAKPVSTSNSTWTCSCGAANSGKFCSECGTKKPEGPKSCRCDKCGYEPKDFAAAPKFCPECGDPFNDQDLI